MNYKINAKRNSSSSHRSTRAIYHELWIRLYKKVKYFHSCHAYFNAETNILLRVGLSHESKMEMMQIINSYLARIRQKNCSSQIIHTRKWVFAGAGRDTISRQ